MPFPLSHGSAGFFVFVFVLCKHLVDSQGLCLQSFSSVGPRVCLAKLPFLVFFGLT